MTRPPVAAHSGRMLIIAVVWVGATLFGLAVAAATRIGPVVLKVSTNHGVHFGDIVAFVGSYIVALLVTLVVLAFW